ncbi:RimJ/RimL family protein N-acetyltransferase [Streptococcus gallinaceus]|uniref:GNAT family N-acetyltransferase n=1 Tax=Streptococcus gallinaceus TaxID=165758 RepID=UPI0020A1A794|nr:GNAT family N-acetyltransferase [Streptococcus gallinaceus]MCP1639741.1 RimJ/RimL family protein N-acetyltransferase [Streptococcus gallinaceus]MCP1770524.1 RimJ/RimL family protein N-acetyltransferase [Streptococcus gallinaceus]
MAEQEVVFEEAQVADAQAFIDFMHQVADETEFLDVSGDEFTLSREDVEPIFASNLESLDQLCLVAKIGSDIIGLASVKTEKPYRIGHIGTVFLAVKKAYWGYGLGRTLLEEVIKWAEFNQVLGRLSLTVQVRNERAVQLYQSLGFEIEGVQKRGARTDKGEWLDLYYMGRMVE